MMKAAVMTALNAPLEIQRLPDPTPGPTDAVIGVEACGICRSDWHTWQGDFECDLPRVMGHEFGGVIEAVGAEIPEQLRRPTQKPYESTVFYELWEAVWPSDGRCASAVRHWLQIALRWRPPDSAGFRQTRTDTIQMESGKCLFFKKYSKEINNEFRLARNSNMELAGVPASIKSYKNIKNEISIQKAWCNMA